MSKKKNSETKGNYIMWPLIQADRVTTSGVVYTGDVLQRLADHSNSYVYDKGTLYGQIYSDDYYTPSMPKTSTKAKLPKKPKKLIVLTKIQRQHVDQELSEIDHDTNARLTDQHVQGTKVWMLLHRLLDSGEVKASTLLNALCQASKCSNKEIIYVTNYDNIATVAHKLIEQYLLDHK